MTNSEPPSYLASLDALEKEIQAASTPEALADESSPLLPTADLAWRALSQAGIDLDALRKMGKVLGSKPFVVSQDLIDLALLHHDDCAQVPIGCPTWTRPRLSGGKIDASLAEAYITQALFVCPASKTSPQPDIARPIQADGLIQVSARIDDPERPARFLLCGKILQLAAMSGHRGAMLLLRIHILKLASLIKDRSTTETQASINFQITELYHRADLWAQAAFLAGQNTTTYTDGTKYDPLSVGDRILTSYVGPIDQLLAHPLPNMPAYTSFWKYPVRTVVMSSDTPSVKKDPPSPSTPIVLQPRPPMQVLLSRPMAELDDSIDQLKRWEALDTPLAFQGAFDPDATWSYLHEHFPWMDAANEQMAEAVAWSAATGQRIAPMLLVGPPGIGKTSWAKAVGRLCHLPTHLIPAVGISSLTITGLERSWKSAHASIVAETMLRHRAPNPLIFIDDLDRCTIGTESSHIRPVTEALMPLLETETASVFTDCFLGADIDASCVNWIFSANTIEPMPRAFLDRVTIAHIHRPTVPIIEQRIEAMVHTWTSGAPCHPDMYARLVQAYAEHGSLRVIRDMARREVRQMLWKRPGLHVVSAHPTPPEEIAA